MGQKNAFTYRQGFTLLETVVALTVILAAVVGPVSLITRGLVTFSLSKNKVIAANLAQEGIELVRLIRENNIACDIANGPAAHGWNRDPEGGVMPSRMRLDATDISAVVRPRCGATDILSPRISVSSCSTTDTLLFDADPLSPTSGMYGYRSGTPTIFRRCIEVVSPVREQDRDLSAPASAQMDVISTVTWDERGTERSVALRERLYDWR